MSITAQVVRDLRKRIRSGEKLSGGMTLQRLSREYGVSVTPVRSSLREMVKAGLIVQRENGRYEPNQGMVGQGDNDYVPDGIETTEDFYRRVSHAIILRSLHGDANYIRIHAAAEAFGAGRSALRDVFARLAGERLLEHVPRCGWCVRPFRRQDLKSFLSVCEVLEVRSLKEARSRLVPEDLERLLAGNSYSPGEPIRIDDS